VTSEDQQPTWTITLDVEHGKCREMANALRASVPAYTTDTALLAVPTYTAALNHWGFSGADVLRELGLDITRVLHASEDFEFPNGPLREGQKLVGDMRVVSKETTAKPDGRLTTTVVLRTDFRDRRSGEPALAVNRTIIERSRTLAS
jgi:hypothetical protein